MLKSSNAHKQLNFNNLKNTHTQEATKNNPTLPPNIHVRLMTGSQNLYIRPVHLIITQNLNEMKRLLTICFLFMTCWGFAQNAILTGRIVDETNLPLAGTVIEIENVRATVSDHDGLYSLTGLPSGSHLVRISFLGYETMEKTIDLTDNAAMELNVSLKPGLTLAPIVVSSQLRGQARALNNQLSSDHIVNIIAADQIGRFPDANVGDALKRIPGINVQYDQGEARFGNIRGTAPQLNSVTINGERIPSAEAEVRSIQLDLIPSDMIQTVEVSKAVTPDMDADAIGGSVNLVTRAAPAEERISGTIGGGYNLVAEKPSLNLSLVYGNRFANDRLGAIFSASVFDNNIGSDNVEAEWTYDDDNDNDRFDEGETYWPEEIQVRQYYLQRIRQSYSLSLDYKIDNKNTIFLKGIYNNRKDWENRYRSVYKDIEQDGDVWVAELERQTKSGIEDNKYRRLENQQMMNYSLSGNHIFGKLKTNWSVNYAKASEDRPNERYWEYGSDDVVPVSLDFSNEEEPKISAVESAFQRPSSSWELNELTEEFQYTEDIDVNARLDFELPLAYGAKAGKVKFGGRLRSKDKSRDNDFYEYEPTDDATFDNSLTNLINESKDNFLAGDYSIGEFVDEEYVGNLNLTSGNFEGERDLSELAGNFQADETILGGYALLDQKLSNKFSFIAGVRVEATSTNYSGFAFDDEAETLTATPEQSNDYVNVLPGLHMNYKIQPKTILRFAYTNTLARPNYFDLVPYREIEDGEELSIGNSELDPTTSTNIDVMAEHYFGTVGVLSGGVFYKDIKDFIVTQSFEDYTFEGTEWADFSQPINGGNARLTGFEFAFQRQLDFISSSLSPLGIYLNYTYTNSEVTDFNFEGREDEELSLPGSPEHTLNASLSYDAARFTTRLSFNYASDFLDEVGDEAFGDRYYDAVTYLDFNINYGVSDRVTIYANANNILNQPLRYFQGVSSRTMQSEFYNARFDLGLKFDLNRANNK